ncbi:type II toxin-antitoxin system VapC family toxin [Phycicoccus flavus]|uniref:type II toxin-antitoxin system VapC family toxin n=1 Tax=Phycicoccus flavus TaxID=2502783 RepID=UPI000FEC0289|nr:type II toxin-antitoxin system VapC family toxin [Phycicoccus flavus]NHA69390.1 type II toxin-antitoxin system VapC family toxin [Phycicoccus flavus]
MIVVDCAAVVDALAAVDGGEALEEELARNRLHAPSLLDYEVGSAVRGLVLGGHLGVNRARDLLADYDALPVRRWPDAAALRDRAFDLRANVSAYDAAYVVLAEALGCPLLTRDARLARAVAGLVEVRLR